MTRQFHGPDAPVPIDVFQYEISCKDNSAMPLAGVCGFGEIYPLCLLIFQPSMKCISAWIITGRSKSLKTRKKSGSPIDYTFGGIAQLRITAERIHVAGYKKKIGPDAVMGIPAGNWIRRVTEEGVYDIMSGRV